MSFTFCYKKSNLTNSNLNKSKLNKFTFNPKFLFLILFVCLATVSVVQAQIDSYYKMAEKAYTKMDYPAAIAGYSKIIEKNKKFKNVLYKRGMSFLFTNQIDSAMADFNDCLQIDSNNIDALNSRGLCLELMGQVNDAMVDYNHAIALDSNFAEAYINRGNAYVLLKDLTSALLDLNKAVKLDPKNPSPYFRRTKILQRQKNFKAALDDLNSAIKLGMNGLDVYMSRANLHFKMENYKDAVKDYNYILSKDNKNLDALNNRAVAYDKMGNERLAEADRNKLQELSGVGFKKIEDIVYRKVTSPSGEISIDLPNDWKIDFAHNDTINSTDLYGFAISPKDSNVKFATINVSLNKNMDIHYQVSEQEQIMDFWKGSINENTKDYKLYTVKLQKQYDNGQWKCHRMESVMQMSENDPVLYQIEIGMVKKNVLVYAYFQSLDKQYDYFEQIFNKSIKSLYIKD